MDKNRFSMENRQLLTETPIGRQCVAYDLLQMEAAAEDYKGRNGRPADVRCKPWDKANVGRPVSNFVVESGELTNPSSVQRTICGLTQSTAWTDCLDYAAIFAVSAVIAYHFR